MKNILLLIGSFLYSYGLFGQFGKTYGKDVVHLSYNYFDEIIDRKKVKSKDSKNKIVFIFNGDQYDEFEAIIDEKNPILVKDSEFLKNNIIMISEIQEKSHQIFIQNFSLPEDRATTIHKGQVFKQIFLYEKTKEGLIYRYEVSWVPIYIDI